MIALLSSATAFAQGAAEQSALRYLHQNHRSLGLAGPDVNDLVVVDQSVSSVSGVTHLYFQQMVDDVPVYNGIVNVAVGRNGNVLSVGNRAVPDLRKAIRSSARGLSPEAAVRAAGRALGLDANRVEVARTMRGRSERVVVTSDISNDDIPTRLVYFPTLNNGVYLAWVSEIYVPEGGHLWEVVIDAASGAVLSQEDLTDHDQWAPDDSQPAGWSLLAPVREPVRVATSPSFAPFAQPTSASGSAAGGTYRVYAVPFESPSHAGDPYTDLRTLESNPADATASPLGWHTDGTTSWTITRGNNVHAYNDLDANNLPDPGSEPDGGAGLVFDFPLDFGADPTTYQFAAITNLFYWNNVIHDITYQYGFDEASGNFQVNNLGKGGVGNDDVRAEALDGSGTNNANFGTPSDGGRPRMQMFRWTSPASVTVTAPASVAGTYEAASAGFGSALTTAGFTGTVELGNDGTGASTTDACEPLVGFTPGRIALVDRGSCAFVLKVKNAQNAGAIAAIVVNNVPGGATAMGGADPTITIPSVMISLADGDLFKANLPVSVKLAKSGADRDSDFDNGIIVHEYAHGISNRLTGGPGTASCLSNYLVNGQTDSEQMGEGWSDYYALMLTDTGADDRGIGTYSIFQQTTGQGIRPFPYSTSFSVNPSTYALINNPGISVPHGVGSVWATMLWDMSRDLVGRYGFDEDIYAGTGGNNLALQLVTEGLKIQPCRPGFVDGRDAILAADLAITSGANQCLIWDAFARRGLGASADQGFYYTRFDGTEAFDVPVSCSTSGMVGDQVRALQAAGSLNRGQANALLVKLTNASSKLASGQAQAAVNEINAFINQVQAFVNAGVLTAEQGQTLIDGALGLIARIQESNPSIRGARLSAAVTAGLTAGALPTEFALDQNFPNPYSSATEIAFALPEAARVRLRVFDVMGREVATVVDETLEAGFYRETFDSRHLASGTYVYRIEADGFVATRQMSVVR